MSPGREKAEDFPQVHITDTPALATSLHTDLSNADEALAFLSNPQAHELTAQGNAILNDPVQYRKLVRKIDFAIAPLLAAVYFLQFLDKTTLQFTAVMGLPQDTKLKGQDYNVVSLLFYVGFLVAEFPTQYLAQRTSRPALYLGVNIMLWGVVLACHGACTSFIGLAICRTLLGVFESCVAPILVLIIAMWYKQAEQAQRISYFYVCSSISIIFGGLVSYGVSFIDGKVASWRIFFIVIGVATIGVGALVCAFLPDSPVKARRFRDAEKAAVLLRVKDNWSGTLNSTFKKAQVFETFRDVRVWLICICTLLSSIPNGGLSNFSSILLTTFGFSRREALILLVPGAVIGLITVLVVGYLSDKWGDRSSIMLLCIAPTILGAGLMIGLDPNGIPKNKAGLLAAGMLCSTFGASFMLLLAWNASNIGGHTKKVTVNAMTLVSFSLGNILGALSFQKSEAPGYKSGKISIAATLSALCVVVLFLRWHNDMLNKKNERVLDGMSEGEKVELGKKMLFADETDRRNPFFRYTH